MADQTVYDLIYNTYTDVKNSITRSFVIKTLEDTLGINTVDYRFNADTFPEDLGSEQLGHYMIMRFYTPDGQLQSPYGSLSSTGFTRNNYNVALFMPNQAGGGIFPNFSDTHEYPDIFMTNVLMNQIGALNGIKGAAALTGRAINPGVQVLYKTTHLRTFNFVFLMAPRSEKESQSMERIIKTIRKYSAPEDNGAFYRSPAEVEIEFHFNGKQNPHIIKLKRQVVTYIDVNYAPQGFYSTFSNGYPVSCMLGITTREMEIIDRQDVEDGF